MAFVKYPHCCCVYAYSLCLVYIIWLKEEHWFALIHYNSKNEGKVGWLLDEVLMDLLTYKEDAQEEC